MEENTENFLYNKIYARTDSAGKVIHVFSQAFEEPKESDVCIDETNFDRHGAQKYPVTDENGYYNYIILNGKLSARDKTKDFEKENICARISRLKELLKDSDYKALKFSDGAFTEEEYAPIRLQRQEWRREIKT